MASSVEKVECPHCHKLFKPMGLGKHKKACQKRLDDAEQEHRLHAQLSADKPDGASLQQYFEDQFNHLHI
jgi:hypothetical protein